VISPESLVYTEEMQKRCPCFITMLAVGLIHASYKARILFLHVQTFYLQKDKINTLQADVGYRKVSGSRSVY
jgi:hypothetical protein